MINMHPLFRHGKDANLPVQTLTPFVWHLIILHASQNYIFQSKSEIWYNFIYYSSIFVHSTFINATHIFILFYSQNFYTKEKNSTFTYNTHDYDYYRLLFIIIHIDIHLLLFYFLVLTIFLPGLFFAL